MPASPEAFENLSQHLRRASSRQLQDGLLDLWLEYRDLATEWDADQWGFGYLWMRAELQEMNKRPLDGERLKQ